MLATVFYMQPIGYALATLVTLGVTWGYRHNIPSDLANAECNDQCIRAVDRSWRIIIGLGAVPAVIAIFFRRSIPESPLYTADVINQPDGALADYTRLATDDSDGSVELGATPTPQIASQDPPIPLLEKSPTDEDDAEKFSHRWTTYWDSFHAHFIQKGFWLSLLGVSLSWRLLDMSYYALGSSSSTVVTKIFNAIPIGNNIECTAAGVCSIQEINAKDPYPQSLYFALFANAWRSRVIVCAGSLIGGAIMIVLIKSHSPRTIQMIGFLIIIPLFLLAGLLLDFLSGNTVTIPTAIIYFIAQLFFEVGPNFTTFMLPAEIFPTRHRAFAHGIAAASGKLGASLFQIFFQFVTFDNGGHTYSSGSSGTKWLGYTVLCFMPIMLVGAVVTWIFVPEMRIRQQGDNRQLDELETLGGKESWTRAK
jgi:PHS family inorganic phosphate transporter-like MFS transporter